MLLLYLWKRNDYHQCRGRYEQEGQALDWTDKNGWSILYNLTTTVWFCSVMLSSFTGNAGKCHQRMTSPSALVLGQALSLDRWTKSLWKTFLTFPHRLWTNSHSINGFSATGIGEKYDVHNCDTNCSKVIFCCWDSAYWPCSDSIIQSVSPHPYLYKYVSHLNREIKSVTFYLVSLFHRESEFSSVLTVYCYDFILLLNKQNNTTPQIT